MREPRDGMWEAGQVCLGNWQGRNLAELKTFVLGWVIKAFFLPLMVSYLYGAVKWAMTHPFGGGFTSVFATVTWFAKMALFADLSVAAIGYVLTLRLLDTHIRSVNPLVFGWLVAIMCYQPFWSLISGDYLSYGDGFGWWDWLRDDGVLVYLWGGLMMLANVAWVWANMMFGLRFSNLTHRGILTNGPFRWTKHPSYVAKNTYWWLLGVPFISMAGPEEALRNCLLLLLVNAIYFARARTEERHLSEDPTYVAYAQWVGEHGAFRWLGKLVPALAYRPPAAERA
jgi:protein-S-isoprenylcysteine O-methyltransferase Ste14